MLNEEQFCAFYETMSKLLEDRTILHMSKVAVSGLLPRTLKYSVNVCCMNNECKI